MVRQDNIIDSTNDIDQNFEVVYLFQGCMIIIYFCLYFIVTILEVAIASVWQNSISFTNRTLLRFLFLGRVPVLPPSKQMENATQYRLRKHRGHEAMEAVKPPSSSLLGPA